MRGVRSLSGLAGPVASLAQAGGGSSVLTGAATFTDFGTFSWVVPDGVTMVSAVCVGAGSANYSSTTYPGTSSSISRGATTLCLGVGDGSGDTVVRDGGGDGYHGAAGGYSANGNSGLGGAPAAKIFKGCGGVGLWGEGPSATPNSGGSGSGGQIGRHVADIIGGDFGGASYGGNTARFGGGLSYVNSLAVTPGETLTIIVGEPGSTNDAIGGCGGVNIVWGRGDFPNLDGVTVTDGTIEIGAI